MQFRKPPTWRKGQTLFNFLEWLHLVKKYPTNQSSRMADPFHVGDEQLDELFSEYLLELEKGSVVE